MSYPVPYRIGLYSLIEATTCKDFASCRYALAFVRVRQNARSFSTIKVGHRVTQYQSVRAHIRPHMDTWHTLAATSAALCSSKLVDTHQSPVPCLSPSGVTKLFIKAPQRPSVHPCRHAQDPYVPVGTYVFLRTTSVFVRTYVFVSTSQRGPLSPSGVRTTPVSALRSAIWCVETAAHGILVQRLLVSKHVPKHGGVQYKAVVSICDQPGAYRCMMSSEGPNETSPSY